MSFKDSLFYYHGVIVFGVGVLLLFLVLVFTFSGDYVCQVQQINSRNYSFNISCFEIEMWCNEHGCESDRLDNGRPTCYCNIEDMIFPIGG